MEMKMEKELQMKKSLVIPLLALASSTLIGQGASAQEVGKVLSSTPIVQQVAVPRQVCSSEQVAVQQEKSGAGALMGAIAGGAMGNAVGKGAGNAAATMLGLVGGAIMGDKIEGQPAPQVQTVQRCTNQNFLENRTVGYNVIYEYAGKQYTVQMPQDPGPTINLQVSPVAATTIQAAPAAVASTTVTTTESVPVIVAPRYYAPYYPPISFGLDFGFWGGRRWH